MRRPTKKIIVALAGVAALVAGAGGAYAYWTAGGTGTGTAATGTSSAITVNQTSTITGLHPGDAAQTLSGNFTNGGTSPVYVTSVSVTVSGTSAGAGCTAADYTIAGSAPVGAEVAPGTGGAWTGLTIKFNNDPLRNQDACKLATVNLAYTSS
jgi:hypothetical protein